MTKPESMDRLYIAVVVSVSDAHEKCTEVPGSGPHNFSLAIGSPGERSLLKALKEAFSKEMNTTLCWIKAATGEALKLLKEELFTLQNRFYYPAQFNHN